MSQRPDRNTPTPDDTGDTGERTTRRDPINPATSAPTIGGTPAMPGTREHEREVRQTASTPFGITTGLLWTVGILLVVAVAVIIFFAM